MSCLILNTSYCLYGLVISSVKSEMLFKFLLPPKIHFMVFSLV